MAVMTRSVGIAVLACALAGGAFAAAGKDYSGTSQKLAPTVKEIAFTSVVAFQRAKKPAAAEARGFKDGVVAFYQKGTQKKPVQAVMTIYVYANTADAKLAYNHSCSACLTHNVTHGIALKSGTSTKSGTTTLTLDTTCRNIFISVAIAGEALKALNNDAGVIAGRVYNRAIGMGMSACT